MSETDGSVIELYGRLYRVLSDKDLDCAAYFERQRAARAPHMAEFRRVVKAADQRLTQLQAARKKLGLPYPTSTYEGSAAHENEFFRTKGVW